MRVSGSKCAHSISIQKVVRPFSFAGGTEDKINVVLESLGGVVVFLICCISIYCKRTRYAKLERGLIILSVRGMQASQDSARCDDKLFTAKH